MTSFLLRLSPTVLVTLVVELALVAAAGVLTVHPPPPEPVARPVTFLCGAMDATCWELEADAVRRQAEMDR